MVSSLEAAGSGEWARVFQHFLEEARLIRASADQNTADLKKLLRSINLCFSSQVAYPDPVLNDEYGGGHGKMKPDFSQAKARLRQALIEMDARFIEYVN
jgi:hypothetical protein